MKSATSPADDKMAHRSCFTASGVIASTARRQPASPPWSLECHSTGWNATCAGACTSRVAASTSPTSVAMCRDARASDMINGGLSTD